MKRLAGILVVFLILTIPALRAQDCSIISKANDILPDRLCAPVNVDWEVSYRGVNDGGSTVEIRFEWDDGSSETISAVNIDPDPLVREWAATANHTYTSIDGVCNYQPLATLIVNGVECSSSSQEQIVTVWDNDDNNGGELLIDPPVYPICIGNGDNVQFQDNTQFNCVPPQENDVPNVNTRWIQWIYGTDITMTGTPVTIDGTAVAFPYTGAIIELTGPVTSSGELSQIINVANDKLVGQYFEVTLRYWNYCNPYDDPAIPGLPADLVNGDNDPVTTTAQILIVDEPDATIDPVSAVCEDEDPFVLTAADAGGIWTGTGIINPGLGDFSPEIAGPGNHIISYEITDGNNCTDSDTVVISVRPSPDATITPAGPFCLYDPPYALEAASSTGTWTGTGIINSNTGLFDPATAGPGSFPISFETLPDAYGCIGTGYDTITVLSTPYAEIISPDSAWCAFGDNSSTALIIIDGTMDIDYEIVWESNGEEETISEIENDSFYIDLDNENGENLYRLLSIREYFEDGFCEQELDDSLQITIYETPELTIETETDGICNPVESEFHASGGFANYEWEFGDGGSFKSDTSFAKHTFYYFGNYDTTYTIKLVAETQSGCIDSISKNVSVYPNPDADFFVSPSEQDYPDTIFMLTNLSTSGDWSYLWDFDDGTFSSKRQPIEHGFSGTGYFDIQLTVFSEHCSDSITRQVLIMPPEPVAYFEPDTFGCPPVVVQFINTSKYGESYIWDFDDGTFSTEENPEHTFYQPKVHNVVLKVSGLNGEAEFTQIVDVYQYPQAFFTAYPTEAQDVDQLFRFVNNSQNAVRYYWDFGDGSVSTEETPDHTYGKEGVFDISLYAWSEDECTDTLIIPEYITVNADEGVLQYPNVFRWNGSGSTGGYWTEGSIDNTVFHPYFNNVTEYKLYIYSRWGELIYESNDIYKGWDGYLMNGKKATQGVYVYRAVVTYISGRSEVIVGDVTFLH